MTTYCIADDVAWVSRDDLDGGPTPKAYAALLPTGRPMALEGSACLVWLAVADGGTVEEIADRTAQLAGIDPDGIRSDVRTLIDSLVSEGLVRAG